MTLPRPFGRSPLVAAVLLSLAACGRAAPSIPSGPTPEMPGTEVLGEGPEIVEEMPVLARDLLGSSAYDLPVEANSWVEAELDYLVEERHAVIGRWLERADFYEEYVKAALANHGLPTDLHHLAMIESGYLPTVRSRSGAVGIWQFMPPTARQMGLRVDSLVDERMDPVRSTHAAARHLRWLHGSLGDWALAAAAYNAGSGRVTRGMAAAGARNFWELAVWGDLADETKHYVPRLYAMTIIGRDRTRFGFPERSAQSGGFAYDSMQVDFATPLAELASISGVPAEQLSALNPHLFRLTTPPGSYWVWVPAGSGPMVQEAYLASDFRKQRGYGVYVVRRGDSLGDLAELSGVAASRIRELNPGVNFDKLAVGRKLKMPGAAAQTLAARPAAKAEPKEPRVAHKSAERKKDSAPKKATAVAAEHTVEAGETLWGIARQYAVEVSAIQDANGLTDANIVAGRTLRIPRAPDDAAKRESGAKETRVAVEERESQAKGGSGRKEEPKAARHVVKQGDTLWSIAREYNSSVEAIQGANGIEDGTIVPGQKLRIPR